MIEIRKLKRLRREDLHIVDGYVSTRDVEGEVAVFMKRKLM